MFNKTERGKFGYWFAHWCAYQMTALNLGCWKWKFLLHDAEKPWMMLWYKLLRKPNPYQCVKQWHRTHRSHHVEFPGKMDGIAAVIDWECSRFTKAQSPEAAYEYYMTRNHRLNYQQNQVVVEALKKLKLWKQPHK